MYASPRQLPYAPTPYSYTPSTAHSATINLDEEVKLPSNPSERDLLDSLAEIYSIIITLDALEKAFNKDSVTDGEYTDLCNRLIRQYNSNLNDSRISQEFEDLDTFKAKWGIECPRATERLKVGLPATQTDTTSAPAPSAAPQPGSTPSSAIQATENFITFLDALKLGILSKDQLHPLLAETIQAVNRSTSVDFDGRGNIIKWLIHLNSMKAHEELGDADKREAEFQINEAYQGFKAVML